MSLYFCQMVDIYLNNSIYLNDVNLPTPSVVTYLIAKTTERNGVTF